MVEVDFVRARLSASKRLMEHFLGHDWRCSIAGRESCHSIHWFNSGSDRERVHLPIGGGTEADASGRCEWPGGVQGRLPRAY